MRGGKRVGAGRKPGPARVPVSPRVLPVTLKAWNAAAFKKNQTLGEVLDKMFAKKLVGKSAAAR